MIVIATNNGITHLPRLLQSIDVHGTGEHKVCIVDTGSTNPEFIQYIDSLDTSKYIIHKQIGGYDTGAYIYAYREFNESEYLFMHDSMEVLSDTWMDDFTAYNTDVCYYSGFRMCFDGNEQVEWLCNKNIYNAGCLLGVFGPIFYVKRIVLDAISTRFNLDSIIPTSKVEQQHMERGWAMMIDTVTQSKSWLSMFYGEPLEGPMSPFPNLMKYRPIRK